MSGFLSNFSCCLFWAIRPGVFLLYFFWRKKSTLRFFFVFLNVGPYGSRTFKTLLLQIAVKSFLASLKLSSEWASQNYIWDLRNFDMKGMKYWDHPPVVLLCYNVPRFGLFLLALLDFVSRAAVVAKGVRRPLTQVSQKKLHESRRNFIGSYLSAISPEDFFATFSIFKFLRFFFRFCSTIFIRSQPNLMINKVVTEE